jgi:N-acetylglucosaminyl-diphospho-decaprenol L-rhamnosyltransferase
MSAPHLQVVTVTFNNSAAELQRFAQAYAKAAQFARQLGVRVSLRYRDNGVPSGLNTLVDGALPLALELDTGNNANVGYGPGMHALWQAAFEGDASAVVTANPDGAFHPDCLLRLHEMALRKPGHLYEARQFPSEHPKSYDALNGQTAWASGCCVYVSRELYERVGNVDPAFWLYMEDVDYSWRVRANGRQVILVPGALYAHDTTDRELSERARFEMWKAGRLLGWKWGSERFMRQCELMLQRRFADRELPELGPMPELNAAQQAVVDFSRNFTFAPLRWTL